MNKGRSRQRPAAPSSRLDRRVLATIRQHALLESGQTLLVAVSGGADSVALLHLLHGLAGRRRWSLAVAHLHHGIRGAAADEDAAFVKALARGLGLPCMVGRVRVPALAKRRGISLEMAAREARYAFLARSARQAGAAAVAVAHTADDQAETVLLRLLRGAGAAGLGGISYAATHHGVTVIRPLLDISRRDILAYLKEGGIAWREDESNSDRAILRNRVRHELLPWLEREFNVRTREALVRTSRLIGDDNAFLDGVAAGLRQAFGKGRSAAELDLEQVQACVPALRRRVLRLWLREAGVPEDGLEFDAIERVSAYAARNRPGVALELAGGWRVVRGRGILRVERWRARAGILHRVRLRIPGETVIPELGLCVQAQLAAGVVRERGGTPGQLPARASLDASARRGRPFYVRTWRPGDRMRPFGMAGSRKLQDILVDAKVPRQHRGRVPVVECGGEIVWLPGYRIAQPWAVPTKPGRVLHLTMRPMTARAPSGRL